MTAENIPDELELEPSGQLTIGVAGEQRAFAELAPEGKPAPIAPTGDFGAEQELERRTTSSEDDRRARGVVLFNGEEITRDAYDRIRGVTPAEERGGAHANTPDRVTTKPKPKPKPKPSSKRYPCAICGLEAIAEELCYSHHTRQRYCPLVDAQACQRRAERATPKEA